MAKAEFPRKLEFLFRPHPYKILYGGRDGTKSWNIANALIIQAARRPLRILCTRETMTSIRASVHQLLTDTIARLGMASGYTITDHSILFKHGTDANGAPIESEFMFAGLKHNIDNIKSLEGADIVWVEEAQTVSKDSWDKLLPTIRKAGAEVWVSFNPALETDDTYKRWILNPPPGAQVVKIGWEDNRWLSETSRGRIEHMQRTDARLFAHIYGGECRSAIEGAIFGHEMEEALAQGRIGSYPYNRSFPVDTFWDLGYNDTMAVWFAQSYQGWHTVIDYLEANRKALPWYLQQMQQKGYVWGTDWLPHDGVDAMLHGNLTGSKTKSPEMILRQSGRTVRLAPKMLVTSRINAARTVFPQCRFDQTKCAMGIQGLRNYQWGEPSANGVDRSKPLHDAASHPADAFCCLAVGISEPEYEAPSRQPQLQPLTGTYGWMG